MKLKEKLDTNKKKKVIFDFDNTLFSLHLPWDTFKKGVQQEIIKIDPELRLVQETDLIVPLLNKAIAKHGDKIKKEINKFSKSFESPYIEGATIHEQLVTFIKENKNTYTFYIWSSNTDNTINKVLQTHGLDNHFAKIITQDTVNFFKPDPNGFHLIFDPSTDDIAEFVLIGDSNHDLNASKAAGIDFIHVDDLK